MAQQILPSKYQTEPHIIRLAEARSVRESPVPYTEVRVVLSHYHVSDSGILTCFLLRDGVVRVVMTLQPNQWKGIRRESLEIEPIYPKNL